MLRGMQVPPNQARQMMGCLDKALLCEPCVTACVHLAQAFRSMLLQQGCGIPLHMALLAADAFLSLAPPVSV